MPTATATLTAQRWGAAQQPGQKGYLQFRNVRADPDPACDEKLLAEVNVACSHDKSKVLPL